MMMESRIDKQSRRNEHFEALCVPSQVPACGGQRFDEPAGDFCIGFGHPGDLLLSRHIVMQLGSNEIDYN